jgi:hypothetical protein
MTSYLKITNFDRIDVTTVYNLLNAYLSDINTADIQFEPDHILIPHRDPETLTNLDWKLLGERTETYALKPTPRNNIHKGVPTYITEQSYKDLCVPTAIQIRRLTKDGRPLPTLEITFSTATQQFDDLHTTTKLGKTQIRKQIATSSGAIQCHICLQLKPKKNHSYCLTTCSYCAQRGHLKPDCEHYQNRDLSNRLCACCGEDHEATNCPTYHQLKTTLMERRQARALKQLLLDTEEEKHQMDHKQQDPELTKATKRQRTTDPVQPPLSADETQCPYCRSSYHPTILQKHISKCSTAPSKGNGLKQSTLTSYTHD